MFTDARRRRRASRFMCAYALTLSFFMFLSYSVLWKQVTVSIRLFFTRVLCIYITLNKGCNILYVFGLNSTVCSHIVDVHLVYDQVTYYIMMDADLYNSFLLRLSFAYQKFPATFTVY